MTRDELLDLNERLCNEYNDAADAGDTARAELLLTDIAVTEIALLSEEEAK